MKLDPSGQDDEETDFIRAGGMSVARVTEVGGVSEQLTYIYADHLGSPYMGANASGGVMWTDVTTPYGEAWLPNAAPSQQADMPGFTGHIEDSATGLTYMQARYYDPVLARFLSNDPVGFSATKPFMFGRYAYAANDPVNLWDPDGRLAQGRGPRNVRDTQFQGMWTDDLKAELQSARSRGDKKLVKRIERELKRRGERNKRKRGKGGGNPLSIFGIASHIISINMSSCSAAALSECGGKELNGFELGSGSGSSDRDVNITIIDENESEGGETSNGEESEDDSPSICVPKRCIA